MQKTGFNKTGQNIKYQNTSNGKPIATAAKLEGVATILLYEAGVFSSTMSFSASPRSLGCNPVVEVANSGIRLVLSNGDTSSGAGRLAEDLCNKKDL